MRLGFPSKRQLTHRLGKKFSRIHPHTNAPVYGFMRTPPPSLSVPSSLHRKMTRVGLSTWSVVVETTGGFRRARTNTCMHACPHGQLQSSFPRSWQRCYGQRYGKVYIGANALACQWCVKTPIFTSTWYANFNCRPSSEDEEGFP